MEAIRECYLLIANIDAVPDMDRTEKEMWKSEAYGLIAYRYMGMFYRYGGVPKVDRAFDPAKGENTNIPRMTLAETLVFTLELCDNALEGLPEDDRPGAEKGRLTRGAVLAMKARLLLFAARALFNSSSPYRSFGSNNDLICFGSAGSTRWQDALEANLAVLTWADANGYRLLKTAPEGSMNTFAQAVSDYGNATSQPSNPEVLLAYKFEEWYTTLYKDMIGVRSIVIAAGISDSSSNDRNGMTTNMLEKYWMADGSEADWPEVGDAARPGTDWENRIDNIEARCRVDWLLPATTLAYHVTHEGNETFRDRNQEALANITTVNNYPAANGYGKGPRLIKFWAYRSVPWADLPLFRLAETYLNLAEAYNELGDGTNALKYLNEIHLRAGLPALDASGKENIRKLIQRERAVELQGENQRYFDAKHWMLEDIADGGMCGPIRELQFYGAPQSEPWYNRKGYITSYWDAVTYNAFWASYMYLEPFPIEEVNKGAIIQNPGY